MDNRRKGMEWIRFLWSRWKILALKIGTFQSRILLSLFYFLVIPPFAAITKIFTDPLGMKKAPPPNGIRKKQGRKIFSRNRRDNSECIF
jgi:hypothetical protein